MWARQAEPVPISRGAGTLDGLALPQGLESALPVVQETWLGRAGLARDRQPGCSRVERRLSAGETGLGEGTVRWRSTRGITRPPYFRGREAFRRSHRTVDH